MLCPICKKRKPGRFCPAKVETICAVCCGTEREVSIDCPADCAYLISAHRYEEQHQRSLPADTPLLDVRLISEIIELHQQLLSAIAFTVVKFCADHREAADVDILAGIESLANTYKTLASGIVYNSLRPCQCRESCTRHFLNFWQGLSIKIHQWPLATRRIQRYFSYWCSSTGWG